jgi:hypothetical protein
MYSIVLGSSIFLKSLSPSKIYHSVPSNQISNVIFDDREDRKKLQKLISSICNNCKTPVKFQVYADYINNNEVNGSNGFQTKRIRVISPPEAVEVSQFPWVIKLPQLIELLDNKDRGWAAFILIAQMTRNDDRILSTNASKWWAEDGANGLEKKRWMGFWKTVKNNSLYLDSRKKYFMYRDFIETNHN